MINGVFMYLYVYIFVYVYLPSSTSPTGVASVAADVTIDLCSPTHTHNKAKELDNHPVSAFTSITSSNQNTKMASANDQQQQQADLVVLFDSKPDGRDKAQAALQEYESILHALHNAGLAAAGKPGNTKTELIVLISCPLRKLYELVEREKCV